MSILSWTLFGIASCLVMIIKQTNLQWCLFVICKSLQTIHLLLACSQRKPLSPPSLGTALQSSSLLGYGLTFLASGCPEPGGETIGSQHQIIANREIWTFWEIISHCGWVTESSWVLDRNVCSPLEREPGGQRWGDSGSATAQAKPLHSEADTSDSAWRQHGRESWDRDVLETARLTGTHLKAVNQNFQLHLIWGRSRHVHCRIGILHVWLKTSSIFLCEDTISVITFLVMLLEKTILKQDP